MKPKYRPWLLLFLEIVAVGVVASPLKGDVWAMAFLVAIFVPIVSANRWMEDIEGRMRGQAVFTGLGLGMGGFDNLLKYLAKDLDAAYQENIAFQTEKLSLYGIGWESGDSESEIVRKMQEGRARRQAEINRGIEKRYAAFWGARSLGEEAGLMVKGSHKDYLPKPEHRIGQRG